MSARIKTTFNSNTSNYTAKQRETARRDRDVAAYERMCAARPLKPPPMRIMARVRSAGELALARDIKLGAA